MTVHTEISVGPTSDEDYDLSPTQTTDTHLAAVPHHGRDSDAGLNSAYDPERMPVNRKDPTRQSIVSISTTISTRSEPMSPQPSGSIFATSMQREDTVEDAYERLGPVPHLRASLLLAQMSSASNLLDARVTDQAVAMGRANRRLRHGLHRPAVTERRSGGQLHHLYPRGAICGREGGRGRAGPSSTRTRASSSSRPARISSSSGAASCRHRTVPPLPGSTAARRGPRTKRASRAGREWLRAGAVRGRGNLIVLMSWLRGGPPPKDVYSLRL